MPSPGSLLQDVATAFLLVLMVIAWSAGSLVSAFAAPLQDQHLEASSAPDQPVGADAALGQGQLDAAAASAKADWQAARPSADLSGLTFSVADLPGLQLGDEAGTAIAVDVDAAGWGWSQMDLGTVVRHEIGHALGLPHGTGLMAPTLSPGESSGVGAEYAEPAPETPTAPAPDTSTSGTGTTGSSDTTGGGTAQSSDTTTSGSTGSTSGTTTASTDPTGSTSTAGPTGSTGTDTTGTSGTSGTDQSTGAGSGSETVTDSLSSSVDQLQTFAAPSSASSVTPAASAGADVFTIVKNGSSYDVMLNGTSLGSVSGTGTFTIDGLGGIDTLVAPDVAGLWKITKINEGSYQVLGGPTFEFSHVENLTGAATANETYRFADHTGLTGVVHDGTGNLTVAIGDFVRVSGSYDFAQEAKTLTVVGGTASGPLATNVLKLGSSSGTGFVGVSVDLTGSQLGFMGTLTTFALAVVTAVDGSQAWHVFDGTIANPHLGDVLGLDLDLRLDSLQVAVNSTSENGSFLNLGGSPISVATGPAATKLLSFTGAQVSASAPVGLHLGGVLHLNGTLTLTRGGIDSVDLNTGLDEVTGLASQITSVAVATQDPSDRTQLARSADYSKLWNLQVSALQFAFTNANAFIGSGFGWDDANSDEVMQQSEIAGGALGLFAGGINLTFLMLTPLGGMPTQKRFLGLKGYVGEVGLTGLEDYLVLTAKNVEFQANLGTTLETGAGATSTAVVDWVSSFPDPDTSDDPTDGSEDPTPAGYHVFIGGLSPPPVVLDSTDSVIGVSADLVVLSISSFVHISGGFSFTTGGHATVDVHTDGLSTTDQGNLADAVPGDPVDDDPTVGLASNDDGSFIYNVPVRLFLLGIAHASVFVGYNAGGFDLGPDDVFQSTDLVPDAIGLLASGINVGLVIATPDGNPVPGWKLPTFLSLKATIDALLPIGLPSDFILEFHGITLSLNRATPLAKGTTVGVPVLRSRAWVDWEASFPAEGPGDPGLEVPTGDADPVLIDFADPVLGISAERVILAISDFVYITGGFSLQLGGLEDVDVDTRGLTSVSAGVIRGATAASATDPGTFSTTSDGSTLWNVPVATTLFGISHASIFVGYNPGGEGAAGTSFTTGTDAILDEHDLSTDAVGFLANDINIGLVFATVERDTTKSWTTAMPRFFAMDARIALLTPVGLPSEFELRFEEVRLSLNRGGTYTGAPGSTLWVNWAASFPDEDGAGTGVPAGIEVPTGAEDDPVYLDFEDPIFGISAHNVKLVLSDFVFISGGFAFEVGGRENVDVDTAGLGISGSVLAGQVNVGTTASATDPIDGSTRATSTGSTVWNVPVVTTLLGISHASVFVGYNPNADGTEGTSFDTGSDLVLDAGELSSDAIGFLASDINIGLIFASVDKITGKPWMTRLPKFWSMRATVGFLAPIGLPSEFVLTLEGVELTLNRGGPITGSAQSESWVNWRSSFPDPDGSGGEPAGFSVPTGEGNTPVVIDFDDPIFGISATKVTLAISDFVYLTGGFAFQIGGRENVDITTSGTGGSVIATQVNGGLVSHETDPGTLSASSNGQHLWNVPVVTTLIGISHASLFLGYNPNAPGTTGTSFSTGPDGVLDETDLSGSAIGLLANGINVGVVLAKIERNPTATWTTSLPKTYYAVRAEIALLTPVGLPDGLVFRFEDIGLSLNQGGPVSGMVDSNSWIDWQHSFPAGTDDPEGFEVPTGIGNDPISIDFDDPIIGVEGRKILIDVFGFVHISGGFAFEKGGQETVTIKTGLSLPTGAGSCATITAAVAAANLQHDDIAVDSGCTTISNARVETMKLGVYNASLFVGYNPGSFDMGADGILQESELGAGAIGFLADGLNLGLVVASFVRGTFTQALGQRVSFYAVKGHIDELVLHGVPDITLRALDGEVNVNTGSKWAGSGSPGGPSIDWAASFPDPDGDGTGDPAGLAVPTGKGNPPVYIDYDGYLIGGGVNKFFLQISSFVYLSGGFYFEYGDVKDMPLTDGIVDTSLIAAAADAAGLSDLTDFVGLSHKKLRFMTIGAQHVHAFVGLGGPDWIDADGDGEIDRDGTGQIIAAEVNPDAVGLVLDDVNFALAMMTPFDEVDPIRYIALKASAARVALVGIDGLVADARNLIVELNISTPTLYGLPLLPVVDFAQWNSDHPASPYGVKVAAPECFGCDPVVVPFTFDSALIRASGQFNLNVFGVLALSGSLAFNLGKAVDATLANSAHTVVNRVVTMTIGGSNLLGFVGYVPDNGSAWQLNPDGSVHWVAADGHTTCTPSLLVDCQIVQNPNAIGLLINDLDFGIFVGIKTPSISDVTAGVFVATNITLDSFGLIGVPGITALGTLAIMLNLGLALGQNSAVGGIDFKRTFKYDPDGEEESAPDGDSQCTSANPTTDADPDCDDLPGLAVDTGDPANPVLIDFDRTFVSVSLAGVLNIAGFVQALGVFYLEVDDQGVKLLADAQLLIGPDKVTNPTAGNVSGNHATGVGSPILQIGALGVLILNSHGIAADLDVDFALNVTGISVTASARIVLNSTGLLQQVEVPGRLHDFLSDQAATNPLAQDLLDRLSPCTPQPTGAAETVYCYKIAGTAPDLSSNTTVYNLLHNPSGTITTSGSPGAYVVVLIDGSVNFLGFAQARGLAGIRISGDVFQLVFNLHFSIGIAGAGLDFDSSGLVQVDRQGLILDLNISFDADVTSLFHFDVQGQLHVKTYGTDKHFDLDLSGRLDVLGIFSVSGTLGVHVANNAWTVAVSASGKFGPVDISGSGTIRSDGTFSLSFSAGFQIGPDVVHIGAHIHLDIYMENTRASTGATCNADDSSIHDCGIANGGNLKFGFHLFGDAEACAFGICLGISVGVLLDGQLSGNPAIPSYLDVRVRGCVDLLFGDACATIKVATIRLPGTIAPEGDPHLADLEGSILHLNVGSRAGTRVVEPSTTAENYSIVDLGTAVNGTHTIQVNAFGRSRVYKGVTAVVGDFGDDNDSFTVVNGGVPVTISGGAGNDTLISNGSGNVTFNGDAGADTLIGGSAVDTLNGGSGNDYLEGRGGIDLLDGGADDDTFVAQIADVFGESPTAGTGIDTYEIIGTTGADNFGVSVTGSTLGVTYSGSAGSGSLNLAAFEKVVLQANQGADNIVVSGNLASTGLQELTLGLTELAKTGNDADTIVLNLSDSVDVAALGGGGAPQVFSLARGGSEDTIVYPVPVGGTVPLTAVSWGSSLLRLVGSGASDSDLFTVNALGGDDVLNIRGLTANTVVNAGDGNDLIAVGRLANGTTNSSGVVDDIDGALTVNGGTGTDTMTVDDSGDASGDTDGRLTGTRLSGLGLASTGLDYSQLEALTVTLGTGGDTFAIDSTSFTTDTTVDGNTGDDTINLNDDQGITTVHGSAGNDTITVLTAHGPTTVFGDGGTDTITIMDTRAVTAVNGGAADDVINLRDAHGTTTIHGDAGNDTVTISDTHAPTVVHGDTGNDVFRILALHAPTEIDGDDGNDDVLVGSSAPSLGGVLDQIAAYLKLSGGTGSDTVTLDDTGDTTGDIGYVTDSRVAGLGMSIESAHGAALPAWSVTILNATGGDFRLTIDGVSTGAVSFTGGAKALENAINAVLGAGTVTVTRSPVDRAAGTTYLIRWVGSFTGAPPAVTAVDVSLVAAPSTVVSLVVAAMSSGYADYDGFETLTVGLGSGDDLVDVDSTQTGTTGTTTVNGNGGADVLTVETTSGPTAVTGGAGDDSIAVNPLTGGPAGNGLAGGVSRTANLLVLDGGADSDTYSIWVFNAGDSRIDVRDVADSGSNVLNVTGTAGNDVFVLRSGLVAAVNTPAGSTGGVESGFDHAELVTYSNTVNGGLAVNTLAGDDVVALDDNSTTTVINGGDGNDRFFVGQMYGNAASFLPGYAPVLLPTTRGRLTNGVSYNTTINAGAGNDTFSILRNVAALQLNGDDGDDVFVIRTFLLASDSTSDARSTVSSGAGSDVISYVMNAPVAVDGGDGFDTLVLIGTEAADVFVISRDGIWGAGRFISFVGIEKVDVDGAEGDDLFYVVSTSPTVQTRIFGGLGSDTILVGAAAAVAVADDLQGHSGIIEHSVESTVSLWNQLPVDGVAAEIVDNDEPAVVMTPAHGALLVSEAGTTDSYTLRLTTTPSSTVRITVSAPLVSPDDEATGRRTVLLSLTGADGTWFRSVTALLSSTSQVQRIYVKAIDDPALESDRYVVLQHLVVQSDGGHEYDGLVIANAVVRLVDNDRPAVTVVAAAPVRVAEGGATGSYQLSLTKAPVSGSVTVRVTAGQNLRVSLNGSTWSQTLDVTFTSANSPVTVYVQGYDDSAVEGSAYDTITQSIVASSDPAAYPLGTTVDPVDVLVDDNDTPTVRIIGADGALHVAEGGETGSYQVVLTSNPCAGVTGACTVTVHATAVPTKTLNGETSHNDVQLRVSLGGTTWTTSVDLVFDGSTWSTVRTVFVQAFDDNYADGSDYQAFAPVSISRVNQVQGPLAVNGGENPDAAYTIPAPYMLPGERSDAPTTLPNPAFDVIEANQVDTLVVDNGNDVAAETGTLTNNHLTGFGLGDSRTIGGRTIAGGITYDHLESLVLKLGKGQDSLTVLSTHTGRTEITGGAGNDAFTVATVSGVTRIAGDAGNDTFAIGDAGLLDHLGSLLVLVGGAGTDTAVLDDSAETDDQLATITQGTVTGLDMVAGAGADRVYSVTVHGTGPFTITVNGRTTGGLAVGASADDVQKALQSMLFPTAACGLPAGDRAGSTPGQDSPCAQSVYVWKDGSTYLIGFTGELAGTVPTFSSTMTDLARADGVDYAELEDLTVNLGSGSDGVNVRGTTASTHVNTGAGDDLVFVSDAANLGNLAGVLNAVDLSHLMAALTNAATTRDVEALFAQLLHGTLTTDDLTFTGSLDLVTGALSVDTGAGSNTLAVSDHADADADRAFTITDHAILGVAPAAITYTSTGGDLAGQGYWTQRADSGLFGRGISVFLGTGGNAGRIDSVRGGALGSTPYGATLTTVWTGAGNDTVTIGANLPTTGLARLVVHGQTGNDSLVADVTATQPLVLFGDQGSDTLRGGAGDDVVIGDSGRVYSLRPVGAAGFDLVLGGAPLAGDLTNPRSLATVAGDGLFLTADVVRTSTTGVGAGDAISGRAGNDVLLGGDAADTIDGEAGNDVVAGDYAWWDTNARELVSLGLLDTHGGNDTLTGDVGDDVLVGGNGSDTVTAGAGNDWVLGDFGWVNLTTRVLQTLNGLGVTGAGDVLAGNDGNDVLAGGVGGDTISGDAGDDWVLGDFGAVDALNGELHSTDLTVLNGGADVIDAGTGADVVLGGNAGDTVSSGAGNDLVFGDFGSADLAHGVLTSTNDDMATGGTDQLHGDADDDILVGGNLADTIWGDAGDDLVFGDFGQVTSRSSTPIVFTDLPLSVPLASHSFDFVSIFTTATNAGDDVVSGGTGNDIILGQQGSDLLSGDEGDDDLIGGHNVSGGSDAGDTILGGTGNDVVVGDNGSVLRTGSPLTTQVRVLLGSRLYALVNGTYFGGSTVGAASANPSGVETRAIALFDHGLGTGFEGRYGADNINGGDGDDVLFGQLGNDFLQGGAGTDYIEGNGGDDTIYGGLGQDDLIGGSSDLFGLDTADKRPDGRDTIYGGDGQTNMTLARNNLGDLTTSGHANDADVILGDNGRIFKMVGALNAPFLSFTYDTATTKVVPRTVVLLDYTPTGDCGKYSLVGTDRAKPTLVQGTCTNIGGGDFLHGEGGDDVIHGMSGDDVLFGDGQDDDLYGEAGNDWISGGAGQDGIVGDDGLVLTSRNGRTEPLNYLDTATTQQDISGNGPHHNATINVTGTLLKAVDLEPFYVGWNDVLYGGLGNDFVHGGEGDDAISGGEALAAYYTTDPLTTLAGYYVEDNPLQFGFKDPEEFRYYNENDPMRLVKVCATGSTTSCLPFLTTADETGNDGDDALFGDGGNDWMSGGTGVDHLYGGWGHDLLDVDDDKTTMNGANSKVDNDSNADYAFGGAGRDVLIANTKSDRLIDWIGEFNSYLVPFNQFGASTVWRASAPAVRQFLYDLSKADGADQTRAPADARNGEPYGELGLTSSADAEWGDQHGAPDDPQPGNGGTFSSATATTAPAGTTAYAGSTGSTTTTTTFAKSSTTTTTTASSAKIASASVAENKKGGTLTVTLAAKTTVNVRIAVVVVGLDEVARLVTTTTVWAGSTSITGTYALGMVGGGQYEFAWMPSTEPAKSDLVLVIRQIA